RHAGTDRMNFFEHQDWARRRTGLLIFLFAVAVVLIVVVTNIAVFLILRMSGWESVAVDATGPGNQWVFFASVDVAVVGLSVGDSAAGPGSEWEFLASVAVAVVGLTAGASGIKSASLRKGGGTVAEMLGGRLVNHLTEDPHERRLVNVVEEMAIASGTPVPLV